MMSKARNMFLVLLIFCFGSFSAVFADGVENPKQIFADANADYKAGEYQEALKGYLRIAEEFESVELAYNIGNTCFKLDSIPAAILWFERAKKIDPSNEDVLHNLALAKQRTYDKVEMKDEAAVRNWWRSQILGVGSDSWAAWALWFVLFSALTFVGYRIAQKRGLKLAGFIGGVGLAVVALVFMLLASLASSYRDMEDAGVIFAGKIEVMSSPTEEGTKVFNLHEGTKVEILNQQEEWIEVMLEDGKVGWMKKDGVEII